MDQPIQSTATQPAPSNNMCPDCHTNIVPNAYFCFNCGKKIKEPPPSTRLGKQISLYLISFFFPPFGLIPAVKYLAYNNTKAKAVGLVALALTLLSIFITVMITLEVINQVNSALNTVNQLNGATQIPLGNF